MIEPHFFNFPRSRPYQVDSNLAFSRKTCYVNSHSRLYIHFFCFFIRQSESPLSLLTYKLSNQVEMEHQPIPPGGDQNTGPAQEAIFFLFFSIAFILVNLRFYVRAQMVKKLWWDDFFLLLGMVRIFLENCTVMR